MTDSTKTPQKIFLQENYLNHEYGINQDSSLPGMVRYFRADSDYIRVQKILALAFMNLLDSERPEGKMCLSNMECADIEDAFKVGDWDKLFRYYEKYLKKQ